MDDGRVTLSGVVHVPLPPGEAFELFTPSGERVWAEGWDPRFPVEAHEETAPGTVFETDHGGRRSTWIVAGCDPGRCITYARVSESESAGTVMVECRSGTAAGTDAHVTYTLTALRNEARPDLARFAAGYDEFLAHWERAIARHLAMSSPS
jgi:hypothetical protein